jgi:uncharacterized protein (DUF1499 family)
MNEREKQESQPVRPLSRITLLGLFLSLASVGIAMVSGLGSRLGLWHFSTGFKILWGAAAGGGIASLISLAGIVSGFRKGLWRYFVLSCIGFALGLNAFGIPYSWYRAATQLPRIHDITTDTENPPPFAAVLPLRKNAPNPPEYGGPQIAVKQHEAYPDIQPVILDMPPDKAFERALAAAQRMRWNIVDADKEEMRIEATDTTVWFGFKDDIVIRITPSGTKSRVDVRSVSRVGLSDVGTNAARIRKYLRELSKKG